MQKETETLASQYPHLAAAFATIPQGEAHLRRLQDLNNTWQNMLLSGATRQYTEVVVSGDQPALLAEDTFDILVGRILAARLAPGDHSRVLSGR
jgi:lycopene cyclase CruA